MRLPPGRGGGQHRAMTIDPHFGRRRLLAAGLLASAASCWPLAACAAAFPSFPLKPTPGGRLLIAATINGHPVEALLDSAAEASFVDSAFARQAGLVDSESVTAKGSGESNFSAQLSKGVALGAAGILMQDQTVAITDLADVGQRLLGHPLHMILGRELFDAARLRIDIVARTLEVLPDDTEPRGQRLPLKTVNGIELLPVSVEGHEVLAALDTGNGSNVLVGSSFAKRHGLLTDGRRITREEGGGLGGKTERRVVTSKSLEIAGLTLRDLPGSIDEGDSATDLNIGVSVLRHFVVTTDFRAHAVWLQPR